MSRTLRVGLIDSHLYTMDCNLRTEINVACQVRPMAETGIFTSRLCSRLVTIEKPEKAGRERVEACGVGTSPKSSQWPHLPVYIYMASGWCFSSWSRHISSHSQLSQYFSAKTAPLWAKPGIFQNLEADRQLWHGADRVRVLAIGRAGYCWLGIVILHFRLLCDKWKAARDPSAVRRAVFEFMAIDGLPTRRSIQDRRRVPCEAGQSSAHTTEPC